MHRLATLLVLAIFALPLPASAADLLIAQAANFMPAMKEIIPAFEKETGIHAEATYTSTGKLYAQITNGAPFDVFLAADEKRPARLHADGQADKPFVYALGRLVFWARDASVAKGDWAEAALGCDKVAIANTETAPYGAAAMAAMQRRGVWDKMQDKLVHAQNIAQTFQYAHTGSTQAGFCAYSSVFTDEGKKGGFLVVDEAPRVVQAACILAKAPHRKAAERFVAFLESATVKAIKSKYGYE